jgi:hypothetical protein
MRGRRDPQHLADHMRNYAQIYDEEVIVRG